METREEKKKKTRKGQEKGCDRDSSVNQCGWTYNENIKWADEHKLGKGHLESLSSDSQHLNFR